MARKRHNSGASALDRAMAQRGFRREGMGGNTSAFRRVDGDGTEHLVILAGSQGDAPSTMRDAVELHVQRSYGDPSERHFASVAELLRALDAQNRPLQARASFMVSRAQAGGSVTTEQGVSFTHLGVLAYVDVFDTDGALVDGGLALYGIPEEGAGPLFVSSADFDALADGRLHTVDGVFYPRARWAEPGEQDRAVVEAGPKDNAWRKHARGEVMPRAHWQWVWPNGAKGEVFTLPAAIRTEEQMRANHALVARKLAMAADFDGPRSASLRSTLRKAGRLKPLYRPKLDVEIFPQRFLGGGGREEIVGWRVREEGEHLGDFNLVTLAPRAAATFFGRAPRKDNGARFIIAPSRATGVTRATAMDLPAARQAAARLSMDGRAFTIYRGTRQECELGAAVAEYQHGRPTS